MAIVFFVRLTREANAMRPSLSLSWISRSRLLQLTGHVETLDEGIADLSGCATAERTVGQGVASRVDAAHTRARISALLIDARAISGTLRADDALGSAVRGGTLVIGQTGAAGFSVRVEALAVRAARRRPARIAHGCRNWEGNRS